MLLRAHTHTPSSPHRERSLHFAQPRRRLAPADEGRGEALTANIESPRRRPAARLRRNAAEGSAARRDPAALSTLSTRLARWLRC